MDLFTELKEALRRDKTDRMRKAWRDHIIEKNISLLDLKELIHEEYPVAIRFSWLVGDLADVKPEMVFPAIPYFFEKRAEIKIPNFNRSLAKFFYRAGFPEELEGEATEELFKWLTDKASNISTKRFSLLALQRLAKKYPEIERDYNAEF